ncbi:hypothetical protein PA25_16790 [Pseudoalteromonas sp. A25]|uniref:hypothetical protein n=1 Tax=Pseudoalteromonas sp. A25 TaxID=116092 RepID=UPI0012609ADF|nr:hypothetical protein [Pseudoalteromonas sp. A25]BBN81694.1 hypothetical protein PA25_16790 [Pseudoalteromonas sp. A25]
MYIFIVSAILVVASFYIYAGYKKNKRKWRPVQVEGIAKVKQHSSGPLELLSESSLLIEYTFEGEKYCCETAYRPSLHRSFNAGEATYIYIDPKNPVQCLHNAQVKWRYVKLWLVLAFVLVICLLVGHF